MKLYAFLRLTADGRRLFGISQFWRQNGEIDEFLLNIQMAEKYFADLMPGIAPVEAEVDYEEEEEEPEKPAPSLPKQESGEELPGRSNPEPAESGEQKETAAGQEADDEGGEEPDTPQESMTDPSEMPEIIVPSEDEEGEGGEEERTPDVLDFEDDETSKALDEIQDFND